MARVRHVTSQLDYYTFMGFNPEELRQRYAGYAERFEAGSRVLDVGCGRGEFLELLAARGVNGIGLDADAAMVEEVARKGLTAVAGDALPYLAAHTGEFDGIFAAHLVEHLRPESMSDLVVAAAGALKPAGRLLVVTPNPHNLQMQLNDFWIDLQHVRFYSPDILRWVFHEAGLRDVTVGENQRYRSGPSLANGARPSPPGPEAAARGRARRLKSRAMRILGRGAMRRRIDALEADLSLLQDWMRGLYPAAEFFVTGLR